MIRKLHNIGSGIKKCKYNYLGFIIILMSLGVFGVTVYQLLDGVHYVDMIFRIIIVIVGMIVGHFLYYKDEIKLQNHGSEIKK